MYTQPVKISQNIHRSNHINGSPKYSGMPWEWWSNYTEYTRTITEDGTEDFQIRAKIDVHETTHVHTVVCALPWNFEMASCEPRKSLQ